MPTRASTLWFAVVSKVTYSPAGPEDVEPYAPLAVNAWSKLIAKYSVNGFAASQKPLLVTDPTSSVLLRTLTLVALDGDWLLATLRIRFACVVAGKVKRPRPARAVVVSSVFTPLPSVTP